ncbi:TetR/AcrR family transcriptional regulator [Kiloniella sp. b19]|uniref:TetR/AcrR family transcriptional regulator n=1 Tax=Kiloniella sp. GXU_MW_B19 TaxID=3141326 RepID=UPI0031D0D492
MAVQRKSFHREGADIRKVRLIEATLRLIACKGIEAATVRAIAREADVTQGLIRHYFSTKEELIAAAFDFHMAGLIERAVQAAQGETRSAPERLCSFVRATLSSSGHEEVALWAGFMHIVQHEPAMLAVHKKAYLSYRDFIQNLIRDLYREKGREIGDQDLRRLAIAINAVIDGLWVEGGMIPDSFEQEELLAVAFSSLSALLGVELKA